MLKQWLSRLEPVHRAETREEREAIYRFRYRVYFEEFGRELGSPDHERQWVRDVDDEKPTSTLLYTGSIHNVTGTVRLRHWRAGEVPDHDVHELSMDRFPDVAERNTGEIGRLMVRRRVRGKMIIASLLRASYELFAGEQETDLVFCYCSPGLVSYYQQLAMRPFGGRLVNAPDGMMVPLVAVLCDRDYYRRNRSLLAPLVSRYFGPGKRRPLDLTPYRPLFAPGRTGVEFEPDRVWRGVAGTLLHPSAPKSLLTSLPESSVEPLVRQGQILDVDAGTLITRKGFSERELYLILGGRFEVVDESRSLREMGEGELFGECGFLRPGGRRTASVVARSTGRVLVLRGRDVERLMRREPTFGAQLNELLTALMAERLGSPGVEAAA